MQSKFDGTEIWVETLGSNLAMAKSDLTKAESDLGEAQGQISTWQEYHRAVKTELTEMA
ncbi:hypothetical protein ACFLVX_05580 [Chloroflexota bacterium]